MTIKVFESNKDGKIEFSKADLEKLLNDVYRDGYNKGYAEGKDKTWTWTSPYLSTTATNTFNTTNTTKAIDDLKCALSDHKPGTGMIAKEPVLTNTDANTSIYDLSKAFNDIVKNFTTTESKPRDVFEGLAKELNF